MGTAAHATGWGYHGPAMASAPEPVLAPRSAATPAPRPAAAHGVDGRTARLAAALDGVEGWLAPAQAARLHAAAGAVGPGGRIVEIGSFRGRSTIALALGAGDGVEVVAIDPHAGNDRGPQELDGYEAEAATDHEVFLANLAAAGVGDRVRHVRRPSATAHTEVTGAVDVLFVDGAHRYGPARDDLHHWGARVHDGGQLLVHDCFSSIGVTLALLRTLTPSSGWRWQGRTGSLAAWRRTPVRGPVARVRNVAAQVGQLGWFATNVGRKLLIAAGLCRGPWPH